MNRNEDNAAFVERTRQALEQGAPLDAETADRLRQARRRAVRAAGRRAWRAGLLSGGHPRLAGAAAGGLALAGAALVAVLLWHPGHRPVPPARAVDLELLTSKNSLEFYRDLDFYEWLQENRKRAG